MHLFSICYYIPSYALIVVCYTISQSATFDSESQIVIENRWYNWRQFCKIIIYLIGPTLIICPADLLLSYLLGFLTNKWDNSIRLHLINDPYNMFYISLFLYTILYVFYTFIICFMYAMLCALCLIYLKFLDQTIKYILKRDSTRYMKPMVSH